MSELVKLAMPYQVIERSENGTWVVAEFAFRADAQKFMCGLVLDYPDAAPGTFEVRGCAIMTNSEAEEYWAEWEPESASQPVTPPTEDDDWHYGFE